MESNWVYPTSDELEVEWKTENIDSLWFPGYPTKQQVKRYKKHFFRNFSDFTHIDVIEKIDIENQLYLTESLEQLQENIQHMGKNVRAIGQSIRDGSATMPLFVHENGTMRILGGRTRSTIAYMTNNDVIGVIIDKAQMDKVFHPLRKHDFLKIGYGLTCFETKKFRTQVIMYIEGKKLTPPKFTVFQENPLNNMAKELERIKKYLGLIN